MKTCRLLVDPAASGAWNMAVDEALVESAENGRPVLRFYSWSEPTVSLGYFQRYADRDLHPASAGCALVRRSTGGGALVHDVELTYSLAMPAADRLAANAQALCGEVHRALVAALARWGIRAALNSTTHDTQDAFLCFQRRAPGDVLLGKAKIAGSAQRRRRRAVLQHGSILLGRSEWARELPGIADLTGIRIQPAELIQACVARLSHRLGLRPAQGQLTVEEIDRANFLAAEKFGRKEWTHRR